MIASALRRIERDLAEMARDPDSITPEKIDIAARRVGAQAEMIEEGVAE